jgi:L-rhamnose-H+ transport protein
LAQAVSTFPTAGCFFSWIIAPWILTSLLTSDLGQALREAPTSTLGWYWFFGAVWGRGGLTFGLTMRFLGMSLGMAVALGYCAAFGTLMPPIFAGEFAGKVMGTRSGQVILAGIAVCLLDIAIAGLAGMSKEHEIFCAIAGTTCYMQLFFYSMGETQMGAYKFCSGTLHLASIIIFSTLWDRPA